MSIVHQDFSGIEVYYGQIDHQGIVMGLVDSSGILLSEANHQVIHPSKLGWMTSELDILYHL